jgi:hypothetical protein
MHFAPEIGISITIRRLFALLMRPGGGETPSLCLPPHAMRLVC